MLFYHLSDAIKPAESAGIRHGFFTRRGGVSSGAYESLNCGPGSNDAPESVEENRKRVAAEMGVSPDNLFSLYQVHGNEVLTVDDSLTSRQSRQIKADGMVTKKRDIALSILTADCAPVLFCDLENEVIGCAHAGWGGAFKGICEAVIDAMISKGATINKIKCAIGPCIQQASYEVGPEFKQRLLEQTPENSRFFVPSKQEGHSLFNLPAYITMRLTDKGIVKVDHLGLDTYTQHEEFFSYRRNTHEKIEDYGRQISVIALT